MRVGKYATHEVVTTDPRATVFQAATLMRERHVGDLIVVKSQDNLVPRREQEREVVKTEDVFRNELAM